MKTSVLPLILMASGFLAAQPSANAADAIITWTGDGGYSARLSISYDDSFASVSALGPNRGGPAVSGIDLLSVSFSNPSQQPLRSSINLSNGVVRYDWLSIGFNTSSKALTGFLDVGEDTFNPGELYLVAGDSSVSSTIRLVDVASGSSLDTGGHFAVTIVPEPSVAGLMAAGVAASLAFMKRKMGVQEPAGFPPRRKIL